MDKRVAATGDQITAELGFEIADAIPAFSANGQSLGPPPEGAADVELHGLPRSATC